MLQYVICVILSYLRCHHYIIMLSTNFYSASTSLTNSHFDQHKTKRGLRFMYSKSW